MTTSTRETLWHKLSETAVPSHFVFWRAGKRKRYGTGLKDLVFIAHFTWLCFFAFGFPDYRRCQPGISNKSASSLSDTSAHCTNGCNSDKRELFMLVGISDFVFVVVWAQMSWIHLLLLLLLFSQISGRNRLRDGGWRVLSTGARRLWHVMLSKIYETFPSSYSCDREVL